MEFQAKIADVILPLIRKYGFYATPEKAEEIVRNPEAFIEQLISAYQRVKTERNELKAETALLKTQNAELQPKASYYDLVLQCKDLISTSTIAKDYGTARKRSISCSTSWTCSRSFSPISPVGEFWGRFFWL